MNEIYFDWDQRKDKDNQKKHSISFEEAKTVFYDERSIQFFDRNYSDEEDRFIMMGLSFKLRILVVCHCVRENETIIRIISARKATRKEKKYYEENEL